MADGRIRVFLADDHPLIRTGFSMAFADDRQVNIIETADNGFDAIEKIERTRPDIVLMDIDMPGLSGVAAIRALRTKFPDMLLIVLSTYNDRSYIDDSKAAGANGYVLKTIGIDALAKLIVDIKEKNSISSPYVLYLQ
jgi:DNA-binding NarL/FixJ family response regulator